MKTTLVVLLSILGLVNVRPSFADEIPDFSAEEEAPRCAPADWDYDFPFEATAQTDSEACDRAVAGARRAADSNCAPNRAANVVFCSRSVDHNSDGTVTCGYQGVFVTCERNPPIRHRLRHPRPRF